MAKVKVEITEDDIKAAENILNINFNDEQKEVIKCLETKDIQACPGSGKTTSLVAKIYILAKKILFNPENAICVLTHTNVAIDQISTKLGNLGYRLLNYPNHCGTVQSFVDKFLAIPAFIQIFKNRPYRIDDEIYDERVEKLFNSLPNGTKFWLTKTFRDERVDYLKRMRLNLRNSFLMKNIYSNDFYTKKGTKTYDDIFSFKKSILTDGFLSYEDAYSLAFKYIYDFPKIINLFNERFCFVFIDEMQDMDTYQIELIDQLFDPRKTTIQKIGDKNQAIYNLSCIHEDCLWNPELDLSINSSLRFSTEISKCVKNVCIAPQEDLGGNPDVPNYKPKILKFQNENIEKVIPKFGEIIIEHGLHKEKNCTFKVIGWIKKPHKSEHRIPNYWPSFEQERRYIKIDFDSLSGYLKSPRSKSFSGSKVNYCRESIILGLVKSLRINEVLNPINEKYFSKVSLLKYLKDSFPDEYEHLNLKLTHWCFALNRNQDIHNEIKSFVTENFLKLFKTTPNKHLNEFLKSKEKTEPPEDIIEENPNVYKLNTNGTEIEICIDTIHNIKGETHTATLYLETFYHGYDISSILKYLKNERDKNIKKRQKQRLKIAYVAMTRPSHLLCIAIHDENLEGYENDLEKIGWEVIDV